MAPLRHGGEEHVFEFRDLIGRYKQTHLQEIPTHHSLECFDRTSLSAAPVCDIPSAALNMITFLF